MTHQKELRLAQAAARAAGKYLMRNFLHPENNHIRFKEAHEIVTKTDIEADKIIHKIIGRAFPADKILSEELSPFSAKATNGRPKKIANRLWIVDPLDGTNNFAHGIPIFAVCIALATPSLSFPDLIGESHYNLSLGAVYLPYFDEMFWAVENGGAFVSSPLCKRGVRGDFRGKKKISVSKTGKLIDSFILQCHGYRPKEKTDDHKLFFPINLASGVTRRLGAAGYELTSVARGNVDGGYIIGTRPWDSAAGALIIREAGGKVTDFTGKEWGIWDRNILFSNGKIHKELLKTISNSPNF